MLLKITHRTDLDYSDLISESIMELRMAPRQEQDQHRLSFTLAVGPPTAAPGYFVWSRATPPGVQRRRRPPPGARARWPAGRRRLRRATSTASAPPSTGSTSARSTASFASSPRA